VGRRAAQRLPARAGSGGAGHHLLERYDLGAAIFHAINAHPGSQGIQVSGGTIDATIIDAPSSTKNRDKQRDPEMHQTRKGNQWYFGTSG